MEMNQITVSDADLRKGAEEGMDAFLKVFIDKYLEVTGGKINADTMPLLNGYQHTLLGYHFFREEVMEGGFVQLIQNGYGPYIFDNPFAKAMRMFGAKDFSKLIYEAKKIYDAHRADLEKERTEWHNLIFWNKTAEIVEKYVHKGDKLYIEGKLRTRNYDDSKGVKRYITEVFVDSIEMLTPKVQQQAAPVPPPLPTQQPTQRQQQQVQQPAYQQQPYQQVSPPDDLPF